MTESPFIHVDLAINNMLAEMNKAEAYMATVADSDALRADAKVQINRIKHIVAMLTIYRENMSWVEP